MSSFFTSPASERKRKREGKVAAPFSKRRREAADAASDGKRRSKAKQSRDESISGSDSELEDAAADTSTVEQDASSSEHEDETGAERRLRLAERYLENLKQEVDEAGFDAADLDRDIIAERLKEDVSESKGKLYRRIAADYDFQAATTVAFRSPANATTCIAAHAPYVYTATKDATLTKWEIPSLSSNDSTTFALQDAQSKLSRPRRSRPVKVKSIRGRRKLSSDTSYQHHVGSILSLAASPDGRFLATGGADKRLIVWSAKNLEPLRIFSQHRDAVLSLAFRRGTNQLYSGSADRTIKTWSLNELAYVETLFGHQDAVLDVAALAQERCLSAGSRDRTVRLWKVVEETQLVFRGGVTGDRGRGKTKGPPSEGLSGPDAGSEGSIERVAFIDEETFVSGSDNGTLSLWSLHRKKPLSSLKAAHGFDAPPTPGEYYAEMNLEGRRVTSDPQARWITALKAVPYSDLIVSGSWDGQVRVWKVSTDKRSIEAVGVVGRARGEEEGDVNMEVVQEKEATDLTSPASLAQGYINDIDVFEAGEKGEETLYVVAALGKEHRLGRWKKIRGKNGAALFKIPRRTGD